MVYWELCFIILSITLPGGCSNIDKVESAIGFMKGKYRIYDVEFENSWPNKKVSWDEVEGLDGILNAQGEIPEFELDYRRKHYFEKVCGAVRGSCGEKERKEYLALLTVHRNKPVGFLVSYDKGDGLFYHWQAGVVPKHRGNGVMSAMMDLSEYWASEKHYSSLSVKTYPRFKNMISLLKGRGFVQEGRDVKCHSLNVLPYSKLLGPTRATLSEFDFSKTYVCNKLKDGFGLDVRWYVKELVRDKVKEVWESGGDFLCGRPRLTISTVGKRYLKPLWDGHFDHGFKKGDEVELGLDGRGGMAWFDSPNNLCYFRNLSSEKRKRKSPQPNRF